MKKTIVANMTCEQLRSLMSETREDEYLLVDVRQSLEYRAGHIPGAQLLPLTELDIRSEELENMGDRTLIFYCLRGGRSLRAARYAVEALLLQDVFHLVGGIRAWQGLVLDDFPQLESIDIGGGPAALIRGAISLERGTEKLYKALAQHFAGTPAAALVDELQHGEAAHVRLLQETLRRVSPEPMERFDAMVFALEGTLTESGAPVESVVERARQLGSLGSVALLEMALELELRAYDTYKALAREVEVEDDASRRVLLDLAQQEKRHAEGVARRIGLLAGDGEPLRQPALDS